MENLLRDVWFSDSGFRAQGLGFRGLGGVYSKYMHGYAVIQRSGSRGRDFWFQVGVRASGFGGVSSTDTWGFAWMHEDEQAL